MDIETHAIPTGTIEEFADKHGLVMEVHERSSYRSRDSRYYAHFKHCDKRVRGGYEGTSGSGATPEEAIADYAARISTATLFFDCKYDRPLQAWRFTEPSE